MDQWLENLYKYCHGKSKVRTDCVNIGLNSSVVRNLVHIFSCIA